MIKGPARLNFNTSLSYTKSSPTKIFEIIKTIINWVSTIHTNSNKSHGPILPIVNVYYLRIYKTELSLKKNCRLHENPQTFIFLRSIILHMWSLITLAPEYTKILKLHI
jgi:hypothetical protein